MEDAKELEHFARQVLGGFAGAAERTGGERRGRGRGGAKREERRGPKGRGGEGRRGEEGRGPHGRGEEMGGEDRRGDERRGVRRRFPASHSHSHAHSAHYTSHTHSIRPLTRFERLRCKCTLFLSPVSSSAHKSLSTAPSWADVTDVLIDDEQQHHHHSGKHAHDDDNASGITCPVCLENPNGRAAVITPCCHVFCWPCWLQCAQAADVRPATAVATPISDGVVTSKGYVRIVGTAVSCPLCSEWINAEDVRLLTVQTHSERVDECARSGMLDAVPRSPTGETRFTSMQQCYHMDGMVSSCTAPGRHACACVKTEPLCENADSSSAIRQCRSGCIGNLVFRPMCTAAADAHEAGARPPTTQMEPFWTPLPLGVSILYSSDNTPSTQVDFHTISVAPRSHAPPASHDALARLLPTWVSTVVHEQAVCRRSVTELRKMQAVFEDEIRHAADAAALIICSILDNPASKAKATGEVRDDVVAGAWGDKRSVSSLLRNLSHGNEPKTTVSSYEGTDVTTPSDMRALWGKGLVIPPEIPTTWVTDRQMEKLTQWSEVAAETQDKILLVEWAERQLQMRMRICQVWDESPSNKVAQFGPPTGQSSLSYVDAFGGLLYLSPMTVSAVTTLLAQAAMEVGEWRLPSLVCGRAVQIDWFECDDDTLRSSPPLQHLPRGACIGLVELDTRDLGVVFDHSCKQYSMTKVQLQSCSLWDMTRMRAQQRDSVFATMDARARNDASSSHVDPATAPKTRADLLREYMGITDFSPAAFDTGRAGGAMALESCRAALEEYLSGAVGSKRTEEILKDVEHFPALPSSPVLTVPAAGVVPPDMTLATAVHASKASSAGTKSTGADNGKTNEWTFKRITEQQGYYPALPASKAAKPRATTEKHSRLQVLGSATVSTPALGACKRVSVVDASATDDADIDKYLLLGEKKGPTNTLDLSALLTQKPGKQGSRRR